MITHPAILSVREDGTLSQYFDSRTIFFHIVDHVDFAESLKSRFYGSEELSIAKL